MNKTILRGLLTISSIALLSACSPESSGTINTDQDPDTSQRNMMDDENGYGGMMDEEGGHDGMMHDESGDIPKGLEPAENPTYELGESVVLEHGHMPGMEGAEAEIAGAFDTTAYEFSFDPENGGEREENHRWVIQEEIAETSEEPFEPGTEVTLEANHMEGMEGATATIDDAVTTTVYMVDYQPTDGGEVVHNHKWFTEEELSKK